MLYLDGRQKAREKGEDSCSIMVSAPDSSDDRKRPQTVCA